LSNELRPVHAALVAVTAFIWSACLSSYSQVQTPPVQPVELALHLSVPFRFVVYGDTRFTDARDTKASNPLARRTLVESIANAHPAFISITGDISYHSDENDWRIWDTETAVWREDKIPVYPVLGNHDLHGNQQVALANYFARFPELKNSRYYCVRAANTLMLLLDSSLDELSGPQGEWLTQQLASVPADVDFIFIFLHHPPYTSSSDARAYGGGHSARAREQMLAKMLENCQERMHARIVVFSGHVHNYERREHGGVTYFVTGGGGAHAYPIERAPDDPFRSNKVNYHYLLVEVDRNKLTVDMHRLDLSTGKAVWTQPDRASVTAPASAMGKGAGSGQAR
jgi:Icc-related predicted phosphoesterase